MIPRNLKISLVLVLALSTLLACGEKDDETDAGMDSGPDGDTDADSDADSDTDTDTDTDSDTDSDSDTDTDTDSDSDTDTGDAGTPDPCAPNPCTFPPDAGCSANVWETFPIEGNCSPMDGGTASCDYPPATSSDCGSQYCADSLAGCVDCLVPAHCVGWLETCFSDAGVCGCDDDPAEENDDAGVAVEVASSPLSATICSGDDDWWWIDTSMFPCGCEVSILFTHADGDLNAELFADTDLINPIGVSETTDDNELLTDYQSSNVRYVRVYGVGGAANTYTLIVFSSGC